MKSAFTCNAATFKYTKTRRGVNAVCDILKDGKVVATLRDVAERIVAEVTFKDATTRAEFLAEARVDFPDEDDSYAISEYAREMAMAAEEALVTAG